MFFNTISKKRNPRITLYPVGMDKSLKNENKSDLLVVSRDKVAAFKKWIDR